MELGHWGAQPMFLLRVAKENSFQKRKDPFLQTSELCALSHP